MRINIDKLTEKELIDLNNRVVERLNFLHSMKAHATMLEFSIGDMVSFTPPSGYGTVSGILVKYNKKTVTILTDDGQKWNVAPIFLKRKPRKDQENNQVKVVNDYVSDG
jgi:hypothetical protein